MSTTPLSDAKAYLKNLDPKVLFSDIDGTLVGRRGSLYNDFEGNLTLVPASTLFAAHQAGLRMVLISGRPVDTVMVVARLLGINDVIAELGTVLVMDGELEFLWGDVPLDGAATPAEAMISHGVVDWLLACYNGSLELHEDLPQQRKGTILFRGQLDLPAVNQALSEAGYSWAHLTDNGRFNRPFSHLGPGRTHAYHLTSSRVSKASTVSEYLRRRNLSTNEAAAIGDAPSDLELAEHVGAMFIVSNGAWALRGNVSKSIIATPGSAGIGWAEAVEALLAVSKI